MISLLNSRKGQQFTNYLITGLILLFFGFFSILGLVLMNGLKDGFINASLYTGVLASTGEKFISSLLLFDKMIVLVMFGLIVSIMILAFRTQESPIVFVVSFILASFLGFISYFFNFLFIQLVSAPILKTALLSFPNTLIIATNLHWVALVVFAVGSIASFAKRSDIGVSV